VRNKRDTTDGDRVGLTRASGDAFTAAVTAWRLAGWPQPPRARAGYQQVQCSLCDYLKVAFGGVFTEEQRSQIVENTLTAFMAPLHARPVRGDTPRPEDLVHAVENAALERHDPASYPDGGNRPAVEARSEEDDERLTHLAFGATPAAVRAGLAGLAADGKQAEFLIITQYLDLGDLAGEPPKSSEVVAKLKPLESTSGVIDELAVRAVLLKFRDGIRTA
jgi:hypothetical protein